MAVYTTFVLVFLIQTKHLLALIYIILFSLFYLQMCPNIETQATLTADNKSSAGCPCAITGMSLDLSYKTLILHAVCYKLAQFM